MCVQIPPGAAYIFLNEPSQLLLCCLALFDASQCMCTCVYTESVMVKQCNSTMHTGNYSENESETLQ